MLPNILYNMLVWLLPLVMSILSWCLQASSEPALYSLFGKIWFKELILCSKISCLSNNLECLSPSNTFTLVWYLQERTKCLCSILNKCADSLNVFIYLLKHASVFVTADHFCLSLIFASQVPACPIQPFKRNFVWKLYFCSNLSLGCNQLVC